MKDTEPSSRPRLQTMLLDVSPRLRVDMKAVETAVYASSLPLLLYRPDLHLEEETCVWFNAFCGRIYRDFINSEECFEWFGGKITTLLNDPVKLPKPAFVGDFKIEDISFGPRTPVLCNMRWVPVSDEGRGDPVFDVTCESDFIFQAEIRFTLSTTLSGVPVSLTLEVDELIGKSRWGCEKLWYPPFV